MGTSLSISRLRNLFLTLIFLPAFLSAQTSESKIRQKDFQTLTGNEWTGDITILDPVRTNKKVIPAKLKVENPSENIFLFRQVFTDNSGVNATDTLKLDKNGTRIGNETVLRRSEKGDTLIIVTEKILVLDSVTTLHTRYTYKIHPQYFLITTVERQDVKSDFVEVYRCLYKRD